MTIEIPLTRGLVALVDNTDAELVSPYKWRAKPHWRTWYAICHVLRSDGVRTTQRMHSLLTGYARTDHANGDGLDNRRLNLRPATNQENSRNKRKHIGGKYSRFKGVSWWHDRWCAKIASSGHQVHLGVFTDEIAAALAYDAAARGLFGEFAALNFPGPGERSALS